jgi:cytochrome d ubiquinol oxidase subunit I
VQGVLSTAEAASTVPNTMIAFTLAMYLTLYVALILAYVSVVFYLARKAGEEKSPAAPSALEPRHA